MKLRRRLIPLCIDLLIFLCCLIFIPASTRGFIVSLAEKILHEDLYREFWTLLLLNMAITGILVCLAVFYVIMTQSVKIIVRTCKTEWRTGFQSLWTRENLKLFLIILALYFVGISTIIRSNSYYNDDLDRSLKGYRGWAVWGRYLADFLSAVLHMNLRLNDISPLPQIISIGLMAASTLLFLRIAAGEKTAIPFIIAALPIGLSPYFMENYSYKYDSPYMALSVLFSLVPFLFYKNNVVYIVTSFIFLLGMCISYQSSSGIYILMAALITFRMWIKKDTPIKDIVKFILSSILSYALALAFFKKLLFVTIKSEETGYYRTAMFSFSDIFSGTISNAGKYITLVISDFGSSMITAFCLLALALFLVLSVIFSKRNKFFTFFVSLFFIAFSFILSYGAYLVLREPLWSPRAFTGLGFFITSILFFNALFSLKSKKLLIFSTAVSGILVYNLLVFDLGYGNALAEQKDYQNFRTTLLIEDINRSLDPGIDAPVIYIENNIGFSPIVAGISGTYPLIRRIINVLPGGGNEWGHLPLNQFQFNHITKYDLPEYNRENLVKLPLLVDNSYHTIYGDGRKFFIRLKGKVYRGD
jgi:hypothetical protein